MKHTHDLSKSSEFLRLALPLMSKHRVAVTPANYAVWYDYVSGANRELNEEIDRLTENNTPIDASLVETLFTKYVASWDESQCDKAREQLHNLIGQIGGSVTAAGGEVTRYQDALSGYTKQLSCDLNEHDLRHLVEELSKDTESVRATSDKLRSSLEERKREAEQLRKELKIARHEATTDAMTGLANRKAFDDAIRELVARDGISPTGHCLLMADIDRFKNINDTYGHLIGDKVIKFVGKTLLDCVKGKDIVARFGGEEFVILLPDTPLRGALAVAESIRNTVEAGRLVRADTRQPIATVTISIGVACYQSNDSTTTLLARADEALYRAKEGGRNKVVVEQEPSATGTHG